MMNNSNPDITPPILRSDSPAPSWWYALAAFGMMVFHLISSFGAYFCILILAVVWVLVVQNGEVESEQYLTLASDGDLVTPSFILSSFISFAGVVIAVRLMHQEKLKAVLAWHAVNFRMLGMAALLTVAVMASWVALDQIVQRPMNEYMAEMLFSTNYRIPLYVTFIVAAPLIEEVIFRGYMHQQLARTPLSRMAVVMVVSVLFTLIHFQYDAYEMLQLLSLGILLSVIRDRMGSLWPCILVHVVWNAISCVGMEYWLREQTLP